MWRNAEKIEKICGRIFLLFFLILLPIVWIRLFMIGEKADNLELEGRKPERIPEFTKEDFLNTSYQEQLEKGLSDQLPLSETMRTKYLSSRNITFNSLAWLSVQPNSNYRLVADDLYTYKDYDYLITRNFNKTRDNFSKNELEIDRSFDYYSNLPIKNKYQYIATNDTVLDFDNINYDLIDWFEAKYPSFKQAHLEVPDFETYANYYYKNDHHWNYKGSYQGYKDIIRLILGPKEKLLKPSETVEFSYNTKGSRSRIAFYTNFHENFTAYRFYLKKHDTYMNGIKMEYGHQNEYFTDNNLRNGVGEISYGDFYGYDVSDILYDFKQPNRENLIIIGFSYTNALNEIVASHFNKTWVFDTRFCRRSDFEKIISENNIQNILLLPNAGAYIPAMPDEAKGYDN